MFNSWEVLYHPYFMYVSLLIKFENGESWSKDNNSISHDNVGHEYGITDVYILHTYNFHVTRHRVADIFAEYGFDITKDIIQIYKISQDGSISDGHSINDLLI